MTGCDGYVTPDGVCVIPTLPVNTFSPGIVVPVGPITELPNTGTSVDPFFWGAVILLTGFVLFALGKLFERRR